MKRALKIGALIGAAAMLLFLMLSLSLTSQETNEALDPSSEELEESEPQSPTSTLELGSSQGTGQRATDEESDVPGPQPQTNCAEEYRGLDTCEPNDHPVCGWFDPETTTCAPGDPCVRSTFPNECEACITPTVVYWTEGECPMHS